jgi:hypothetical protein
MQQPQRITNEETPRDFVSVGLWKKTWHQHVAENAAADMNTSKVINEVVA